MYALLLHTIMYQEKDLSAQETSKLVGAPVEYIEALPLAYPIKIPSSQRKDKR